MTSRTRKIFWTASAALPALLAAWACSPSSGSSGLGQNTGSNGTAGATGTAGSDGVGQPGSSGGTDSVGGLMGLGMSGARNGQPDSGCFATASKAEQVTKPVTTTVTTSKPVDMYIMYDQSGSMGGKTPNGGTKWSSIATALQGFVNSPTSAGIGIGIGYFPFVDPSAPATCSTDPDCGNFGPCVQGIIIPFVNICVGCYCAAADGCNIGTYAKPDVPIDFLPAVAPQIVASVGRHNPGGGTPTTPALAGAHQYAAGWAAAHPDRKTIVVLATDGDPTGCAGNNVQAVAAIAAAGLAATPSVETFVVGVGSSLTSLNSIAAAGGTGQALIVDAANGDPTQQFLDAMNKIRETVTVTETHDEVVTTAVPCQWTIPPAPDGQTFDKSKVNVNFAPVGAPVQPIGAVASVADCGTVANGWHYDDPNNPAQVLVCPQTCDMITAATDATVNVVFGCATITAIPR